MTKSELFSIVINEPDHEVQKRSGEHWDALAKPIDGLGLLEKSITQIASIRGKVCPDIGKKAIVIMCADNGIYEEGISQTSQQVTRDVAELMGNRRSSVGVMAQGYPADFFIYDVGINSEETVEGIIPARINDGTENFLRAPAMSEEECLAAIKTGIDAVKKCCDKGYSLIGTGEMGIGNTTTSTALVCALLGLEPSEHTGRGAGLSDDGLFHKIQVVEEGLKRHGFFCRDKEVTDKEEAFRALMCLGGFDIAALAGVYIGGALYHVPIVMDGLICATAALTAEMLLPGCREFMIPSHIGREKAMKKVMEKLSLRPAISAELALGEGTGALLLFPMLDMAMNLYRAGTFFEDTDITQYERFDA